MGGVQNPADFNNVVINGGTVDGLTSLGIRSTGAAYDLKLATTSVFTAGKTLTLVPGDADRTITLSGNPTLADWFDQAVKAASNPTFGNLTITSFAANWTNAGRTVADLGTITTVDINGGTLAGVTVDGGLTWSAAQNFGAYKHFINETANTNMTVGLTINQGGNDNQILAFKSSDVATGLTTGVYGRDVEADDFFAVEKASPTIGGVVLKAMAEDAALGTPFELMSYGGTAPTSKTVAAESLVMVTAAEHDGANALANITADGNVFSVRAYVGGGLASRFLVDEDGDLYSVTAAQTFDDYDDLALLDSYDAIRSGFEGWAREHEEQLIALKVLGAPVNEGGLTNQTQLLRLAIGALRRQGHQLNGALDRLAITEKRLAALPAA